ncbi:response regulator [Mesorhizobium sp. BR1-1-3]|uniref:response regulator transcription factor n=1 Tax=Mesorhizobium sp. BR1-1-3 TaxID=2876651 RepID=UPI001CD0E244|nr:response regulator [Mesorhizobium sp. BR1-1-3]MBZ9891494.1 response regulator [Mesorhizobium sp. BR1-1-3]
MENTAKELLDTVTSGAFLASSGDGTSRRQTSRGEFAGRDSSVSIIDADIMVRQALQDLLKSIDLSSQAFGSVSDFLQRNRSPDNPSCIVLDVRLPGLSGLEFQEQLARSGVKTPIVFLTAHADIQMTVRAMKSGAVDFLTKPFRDQDLLDAVSAALERDRARRRQQQAINDLRRRFSCLTERELDVTWLVAAGRMNKQIAAELGISESTVKLHRGSVMRKLNVRTVPDLVRMADIMAQSIEPRQSQQL